MLRFRQFVTLARLTTREAVRQPVCLILMISGVIVTALVPVMLLHRFGEDGKLVRDSAFAVHAVFGIFLTGYAASTSVSRELRSGTAGAVLSKPVGRDLFFLAKYAGVAGAVLLFSLCASMATLLSERAAERFVSTSSVVGFITDYQTGVLLMLAPLLVCAIGAVVNYRWHRPFGSVVAVGLPVALLVVIGVAGCFDRLGNWAPFAFNIHWQLFPVSLLVTVALLVMAALALAVSVVAGTGPTLVVCAGVFSIGMLSDSLFGQMVDHSLSARLLYYLLPNWQHLWMPDALNEGGQVTAGYLGTACFYGATYTGGLLSAGALLFRRVPVAGME